MIEITLNTETQMAQHTGLAHRVAYHYAPTVLWDHEDYYQLALIGLWKACQTYQPEKGSFAHYAARIMHNEIRAVLRKRTWPTMSWEADETIRRRVDQMTEMDSGERHVLDEAILAQWYALFERLDPLTQQIVRQRVLGQSLRRTAQTLHCSKNQVAYRLKKLRHQWTQCQEEELS